MSEPQKEKKARIWARDEFDWYVEPVAASLALFRVERFVGHIWDPCCGGGNIKDAAHASGYKWRYCGTDVVNRAPPRSQHWFSGEADFLTWDKAPLAQNIIMNPPFFRSKGAEAFIRKALDLVVGKAAVFVDIRFLAGATRANGLFLEHPPHRIWIVTPRVSCPPGEYLVAGNKAANGSADWCWLVWDKSAPRVESPTMSWLRLPKTGVADE